MRAKTSSFIAELPLVVKPGDEKVMLSRLEACRRLYNATLGECLKRMDAMLESDQYKTAKAMPFKKGEKNKDRNDALRKCYEVFGFTEYDMHSVVIGHKNNGNFSNRVGSHEAQKIATRAFKACKRKQTGLGGRPRFKGKNQPLKSSEGKNNQTGLIWNQGTSSLNWRGIYLPAMVDIDDYTTESLNVKTKYCRIVWRIVNGKRRWYAQLVQEGNEPKRYEFNSTGAEVGLDIGPSSIAIVGENLVGLETLAESITQPWKQIKRLQRAQDRSRRATNVQNYNANGTVKKGSKKWHKSSKYKARQLRLAEIERRLSSARKRDHGHLSNKILSIGNVVKTEKISYVAFQKMFGKSTKVRAPGMLISELKRKAESADGRLIELDTWKLKMSQYDHVTDSFSKKPLSQRWHCLGSSEKLVQRDVYSAFLAKHASDRHNPSMLNEAWTSAEQLLVQAGLCVNKPTSGVRLRVPTVMLSPSELVVCKRKQVAGHVR